MTSNIPAIQQQEIKKLAYSLSYIEEGQHFLAILGADSDELSEQIIAALQIELSITSLIDDSTNEDINDVLHFLYHLKTLSQPVIINWQKLPNAEWKLIVDGLMHHRDTIVRNHLHLIFVLPNELMEKFRNEAWDFFFISQYAFSFHDLEKKVTLDLTPTAEISEVEKEYNTLLQEWEVYKRKPGTNLETTLQKLHNLSNTAYNISKIDESLFYAKKMLEKDKKVKFPFYRAVALINTVPGFRYKGLNEDAKRYLTEVIIINNQLKNSQIEFIILNEFGNIYRESGELDKALDYYEKALIVSKKENDYKGQVASLMNIGNIYEFRGNINEAFDYYAQSLNLSREKGDIFNESRSLGNIGSVFRYKGDLNEALKYFQQSLFISKKIGDMISVQSNLNNMATIYVTKGDLDQGLRYYDILEINRKTGDIHLQSVVLTNIANIYSNKGDFGKALSYNDSALKLIGKETYLREKVIIFLNIGSIYSNKQEFDKALHYFDQALNLLNDTDYKQDKAFTLNSMGYLYVSQKDFNQALSYLNQSFAISKEIGYIEGQANNLQGFGMIEMYKNNFDEAHNYYKQSMDLYKQISNTKGQIEVLNNTGLLYSAQGNDDEALKHFNQAKTMAANSGYKPLLEKIEKNIATKAQQPIE